MAFVEVIPVHLVDSDGKHLFVFGIDSFLDDSEVKHFVDVDAGSVSVVEDKGVPEGLGLDVVGPLIAHHLKQLFVEAVGPEEVIPDGQPEVGLVMDCDGLAAHGSLHGLFIALAFVHLD